MDSFVFAEETFYKIPNFPWEAWMLILFLLTSYLKRLLTSALIHFLKIQKKWKVYQKQNLTNFHLLLQKSLIYF